MVPGTWSACAARTRTHPPPRLSFQVLSPSHVGRPRLPTCHTHATPLVSSCGEFFKLFLLVLRGRCHRAVVVVVFVVVLARRRSRHRVLCEDVWMFSPRVVTSLSSQISVYFPVSPLRSTTPFDLPCPLYPVSSPHLTHQKHIPTPRFHPLLPTQKKKKRQQHRW